MNAGFDWPKLDAVSALPENYLTPKCISNAMGSHMANRDLALGFLLLLKLSVCLDYIRAVGRFSRPADQQQAQMTVGGQSGW